ncbi:tetratricopeptide repeat-containing sulfotransferase family protein [Mariprofundus ferrooxydans]|uniref:tetratricopeptide repeat-containing sulfotransferase family protein n=1 Tax=Mariprofundus ferrooxydans TaxID=314344 RepID=UPI001430F5C9|nr:sulfotransferase [Mariprofundus ferrooxydans]
MAKRMKLSGNRKRKIEQLLGVAGRALQQGETEACESACGQLEALYPDHPDLLHLRGLLALQQGGVDAGLLQLKQAVAAAPTRADLLASLGNGWFQAGDTQAAMECYRQALALDATDIATHLGMAGALMAQGELTEARVMLERARKRKPGDAMVRMGLFQVCHALNLYSEARTHLEAILARDAGHAEAHYGLGVLALEQGALEEVREHIHHALQANPYHADAWLVLADLRRFEAEDDETQAMQQVYQHCPPGSDARMKLAFALAKVRDDLGDYAAAFELLQEANAIRHADNAFDTDAAVAALAEITTLDGERMRENADISHTPCLFVLGMPRSGSTLVEQILAAHPDVTALGENGCLESAIRDVVGDISLSPAALNALPQAQCTAIGVRYLERVGQLYGSSDCYCDKTLSHIALVGLIHRALPQARFIHLQRDPLDTCFSIYKNNLQGTHFGYGYALSELAQYYQGYLQLMAYWRELLPADLFYELEYEQLVAGQEQQTRLLLQACGLSWSDACMHFQQANHAVQTASAVQVRKPLSTASIGVWRQYEAYLTPLLGLMRTD